MKNYKLLLLCTLFFCACNKEKTPYDKAKKDSNGSASALINGKPFTSTVTKGTIGSYYNGQDRLGLTFDVYDQSGLISMDFVITNIDFDKPTQRIHIDQYWDPNINNYKFNDSCYSFLDLLDGDAGQGSFVVNDSMTDNILIINSYDKTTGKIEGKFNLTMYRKEIGKKPAETDLGDTLHITNGNFQVTVK